MSRSILDHGIIEREEFSTLLEKKIFFWYYLGHRHVHELVLESAPIYTYVTISLFMFQAPKIGGFCLILRRNSSKNLKFFFGGLQPPNPPFNIKCFRQSRSLKRWLGRERVPKMRKGNRSSLNLIHFIEFRMGGGA